MFDLTLKKPKMSNRIKYGTIHSFSKNSIVTSTTKKIVLPQNSLIALRRLEKFISYYKLYMNHMESVDQFEYKNY